MLKIKNANTENAKYNWRVLLFINNLDGGPSAFQDHMFPLVAHNRWFGPGNIFKATVCFQMLATF